MKSRLVLLSALAASFCSLPALARSPLLTPVQTDGGGGHQIAPTGGTWAGPGDTAPTGGSTSTGGSGPSGPTSPSAPAHPGSEAGGTAHGAPARSGGAQGGAGGKVPSVPSTGPSTGGETSPLFDASWDVWWFFHQDEFLDFRDTPRTSPVTSNQGARVGPADEPALRALASVLTRERSTEIQSGALLGLGRLRDPASLTSIRAALGSPTTRVREVSLIALGAQRDEAALSDLESLLRDDEEGRRMVGERVSVSPRVRAHAAYALGILAGRSALGRSPMLAARALSDVLAKDAQSSDLQVACALGLGLVALPSQPGSAGENPLVTPWISRERMLAFLLTLLVDKDRPDALRAQLPVVIARLVAHGPESLKSEAGEALIREVQRGTAISSSIREGCVMALGEIGDADRDEIDSHIRTALLRLTERGSQVENCLAWMALASTAARTGSGESPNAAQELVRSTLIAELGRGHSRTRAWIALALGVMEHRRVRAGDAPAGEALCAPLRAAFAHAQGPEEESGIAMAIGLTGDPEGADLVRARMERGLHTRLIAFEALALGLSQDMRQLEPLRKLARLSSDPFVIEQASLARGLLGDSQLTLDLTAGALGRVSLEERMGCLEALVHVGDRRALPSLISKLGDENQAPSMRAALCRALGGICDTEAKPWYVGLRTLANWRAPSLSLLTGDGQGVLETF